MPTDYYRSALPPGYRLLWYEIERVLGQGGFGITYLARDTNLDQLVAVKEYFPNTVVVRGQDQSVQPNSNAEVAVFKSGRERFVAEARTLARFDHPNIVRVYSVFQANNADYLVMRYEQGECLSTILEKRRTLPEHELLGIVLPMLDGLNQVHAYGLAHRDIQPANILIRHDGSPVLLDFGSAREVVGPTRELTILITPGYAAPEQHFVTQRDQGPWTDIFGLGATLYRAVSGVTPLDAMERMTGMFGSKEDLLQPAVEVGRGHYSLPFLRAIDHALVLNDKERPRAIADWARELQGDDVRVVIDSVPQPTSIALKAAAVTVANLPPPIAPRQVAPAHRWAWPAVAGAALLIGLGIGALLFTRDDRPESPVTLPISADDSAPTIPVAVDAMQQPTAETPTDLAPTVATDTVAPGDEPDAARLEAERVARELRDLRVERATEEALLAEIRSRQAAEQETLRLAEQRRQESTADQPESAETPVKQLAAGDATAVIDDAPTAPAGTGAEAPDALAAALALVEAGQYQQAIRQIGPLANAGDREAQYQIGMLYRRGQGVMANSKVALDWVQRAAWAGHPAAPGDLARMWIEGVNGLRDPFLAYTWLTVAQAEGDTGERTLRDETGALLQTEQRAQAETLAERLRQERARPPAAGD